RIALVGMRDRLMVRVPFEQVLSERRNDRARQQIRGEHRKGDGLSQGDEKITRDSGEEEHRNEDNTDAEGGDEGGNRDLCGAVQDGLFYLLTHLEIPVDVFDFDRGVIDQNAHGEGETAERHDVDGFTERTESEQRAK